jgi:hypothetical protein
VSVTAQGGNANQPLAEYTLEHAGAFDRPAAER